MRRALRQHGANWRNAALRATRNESLARRLSSMSLSKILFPPPPSFAEELRQAFDALRGPPSELKQSLFQQLRGPPSPFQELSKLVAGPPSPFQELSKLVAGPPSPFQELSKLVAGPPSPFQELSKLVAGPPSPFQELSKLGADLDEAPDALRHARAPAPLPAPATTKTGRGAPRIHDWDIIERLDAAYCRTYFADKNRAPTWKERHTALEKNLGKTTPHLKTLQRHLPKIALLKERNSRSI